MKHLSFILAAGLALTAQPIRADSVAVPAAPPAQAADSSVPGAGFPASRYEALWTKSPFAVATPDAVADSPDYSLVLVANINGVSYASVIEKQNPLNHYLLSSDKPNHGMTLTSITHTSNSSETYAIVQKDGQTITLKLEQSPTLAGGPGMPGPGGINLPTGGMSSLLPMPGASLSSPNTGSNRPFRPRIRRSLISLPPPPGQQQQPVQAHPAPPPP